MSRVVTLLLRIFPVRFVERIPIQAVRRDVSARKFFIAGAGPRFIGEHGPELIQIPESES